MPIVGIRVSYQRASRPNAAKSPEGGGAGCSGFITGARLVNWDRAYFDSIVIHPVNAM